MEKFLDLPFNWCNKFKPNAIWQCDCGRKYKYEYDGYLRNWGWELKG